MNKLVIKLIEFEGDLERKIETQLAGWCVLTGVKHSRPILGLTICSMLGLYCLT